MCVCVCLKPLIDRMWDQHLLMLGKKQRPGLAAEAKTFACFACFEDINANILPSADIKQGFVVASNTQAERNSARASKKSFCSTSRSATGQTVPGARDQVL